MDHFVRGMHAVVQDEQVLVEDVAVAANQIERFSANRPLKKPGEEPPFEGAAPRPRRQAMRDGARLADALLVEALRVEMNLPAHRREAARVFIEADLFELPYSKQTPSKRN